MSNCLKIQLLLLSIFLNQFITVSVPFHWFTNYLSLVIVFTFSMNNFLTLPNLLFDGLINLHFGIVARLGLCSFKVMKLSSQHFKVVDQRWNNIDPTLKMKQNPTSDFQRCTTLIQCQCMTLKQHWNIRLHKVETTLQNVVTTLIQRCINLAST